MGALSEDVPQLLCQLHNRVRSDLQHETVLADFSVGKNAKGDTQQRFDVVANAVIRRALTEKCGQLDSAVRGILRGPIWRGSPDLSIHRGSRGRVGQLRTWLPAVRREHHRAASGRTPPTRPRLLDHGGRASRREPLPLTVGRGHWAYRGSHRVRVSGMRSLRSAFLSCELNHYDPTPAVGRLLRTARAVRTYGCTSQAITLVATGALNVHVDVRSRLTAESFLVATLVLEEAGGCMVTVDGHPIRHLESLVERTSLVAAATPELAHEVLNILTPANRTPGAVSCCVILAAGEGLRLSALENGTPKPAPEILGLSLGERVMLGCVDAGVHRFVIVLGSKAEITLGYAAGHAGGQLYFGGWPRAQASCWRATLRKSTPSATGRRTQTTGFTY